MSSSLLPAKYNFTIWRGATFRKHLVLLTGDDTSGPRDLTGYTGTLTIEDPTTHDILLSLTSVANDITFGGAAGTIDIVIDETVTEALAWNTGIYELFINSAAGDSDILLFGAFKVSGF